MQRFRPDAFDPALFLRDHWQKKPLLIRNPWADWANPLEPSELAGLACEEGVEARLIEHTPARLTLEQGPLPEERFAALGAHPWTLLVQAVDHQVPDVAALIGPFRFIPDWRIDDVMVSYAVDGGGVGPHFDQYDVFLIQGLGRRRWRVGPVCDDTTPLLPNEELRLLAGFEASDEWVLEPGDILYVPPGFAHDGVAVGDDCMTYSVGFRAPARGELIEGWADHVVDGLTQDDRYADPDLQPQTNPGEITPEALDRLHAMVMQALGDRDAFARWWGKNSSTPKYPDTDWAPETSITPDEVDELLAEGTPLCRNAASRFAFIRQGENAVLLFVDGQSYPCTGPAMALAMEICAQDRLEPAPGQIPPGPARALITALINLGALAFEAGEDWED